MKNYQITLSNQKKYIWFVIPKCGSNSIKKFLHKNSKFVSNKKFKEAVRAGIDWENYFKFIIVRNPWDRLLSAWQDKVKKQWNEEYRFPQFRIKYLEQFYDKDFSFFVKNCEINRDPHLRPISELVDISGIDFIGKLENLQEDLGIICDKIGIPRQELPHRNKTNHKHYTEYYNDETRKIVAQKYAKDIEMFGYKFGE